MADAKGIGRSGRRIFSIRWIVSGGAAALMTVTVLAIGGYAERDSRQKLTEELKTRLVLHARNIALTSAGALLSEFPELTLQPIEEQSVVLDVDEHSPVGARHVHVVALVGNGHADVAGDPEIPDGELH